MTVTAPGADPRRFRLTCGYCGRFLPARLGRGWRRYCLPPRGCAQKARRQKVKKHKRHFLEKLGKERRKNLQYKEQFLVRQGLTRRQLLTRASAALLAPFLSISPSQKTALHETAWAHLRTIQHYVAMGQERLAQQEAFALPLVLVGDRSLDAMYLRLHCEEVLRDAGEPGDSSEAIARILARARLVEQGWAALNDPFNLSKALLTRANLHRACGDYKRAMVLVQGASALLRELDRKRESIAVKALWHHAVLWKLRLIAVHGRSPNSAKDEQSLLFRLSNEVGTPRTWVEALREDAGYLLSLYRQSLHHQVPRFDFLEQAQEALDRAKAYFFSLGFQPMPTLNTLLRLEMEVRFAAEDKRRAEESVQAYLALCQQYPDAYCLRQVQALGEQHGFQPEWRGSSVPIFSSFTLPYLYLEENLIVD